MNTSLPAAALTLDNLAKHQPAILTGLVLQPFHEPDLERKLLEMGFTEGSRLEVLHEAFPSRDPIAVKVDDLLIALRRKEAAAVQVTLEAEAQP
jgi:ferrous iron transport protein A